MRISDAKTGAGETVLVIDHAFIQPGKAGLVHVEPGSIALDRKIIGLRLADGHEILHASAASFFHGQTQSGGGGIEAFFLDQGSKLSGGIGGEFDHTLFLWTNPCEVKRLQQL